ncbi:MAG: DUF3098 domain-containing protein [Bacteroidales bacterium]|nr:DUF3098 domain-containing protein [Bacteroidales bacterium]
MNKKIENTPASSPNNKGLLIFDRSNYKLLLIGLGLILLGFLLMIGGNSNDPDVFNEDIFSFRRLTLAPILVMAGFAVEIVAILKKPKLK